jgi:hypothetical protein
VVAGEPVLVNTATQEDLDKFKGKLKDKIAMISPKRDLQMVTTPLGVRYNDSELADLATEQIQVPGLFGRGGRGGAPGAAGGRGGGGQGGFGPQAVQAFLKAEKIKLVSYGVANAKTVSLEPQSNPVWPSYSHCVDVKPTKTTTYTLAIADASGNTKTQTLEVKVR